MNLETIFSVVSLNVGISRLDLLMIIIIIAYSSRRL